MHYQEHRDNEEYFRFGTCLCPPHFHRSIELIYNIRTPKTVIVGGKEMVLEEGELLIVPPLTPHVFPPRNDLFGLCVVMPVTYSDLFEQQTAGKQLSEWIIRDKALAKDLYTHLCMLETSTMPLLRQSIYTYVLAKVLEQATLVEAKHTAGTDFSVEVLRYIEKNYRKKLTSESTATALGYNPCYFSSLFNQHFQTTFSSYLNMIRINKATTLLKNHTVPAVAESVGFSNLQSFYYNFKKVTDMTPTEYLRAAKEKE